MHPYLLILVLHGGAFVGSSAADMAGQAATLQRLAPSAEVRNLDYTLGTPDVGYRYVRRVARAHRGPTAAYGFSAGGYLAARLAANGDLDAGVSVEGLYDLPSFAVFRHVRGPFPLASLEVDTLAHRREVALRPRGHAVPNLLVHNDRDPMAPYGDARAYVARNVHARLVTTHGTRHRQSRRTLMRAMRWLLDRFPPGATGSRPNKEVDLGWFALGALYGRG